VVRALIPILHEDEDLVCLGKPSGVPSVAGWARDAPSAVELTEDARREKLYPLHRLDRPTSGVLVCARSSEAARALSARWDEVAKRYLGLCRGIPAAEGVIDHPLPKGEEKDSERVPATTRWERLAASRVERVAWLALFPETGRLHQIRRHLKHVSHPLLGDVNYGKGDWNRRFREQYGLTRLALHAEAITFPHPRSGLPLTVRCEVPDDLGAVLTRLEIG
jgi:tRNA pseudouridine65 synthase